MQVVPQSLQGLILIAPQIHRDARGYFLESYQAERYRQHGIDTPFIQDNHSCSAKGTLRGLHLQTTPGQAKLVTVHTGQIFDVAVDMRPTSPTFGRWQSFVLDDVRHQQLFIPRGFAHGFAVLSEQAHVVYKVSSCYSADTERSLLWNDPRLQIPWPTATPLLSERDRQAPGFAAVAAELQGLCEA